MTLYSVAMESNHDLILEWKGLVCLDDFELEVVMYFKLLPLHSLDALRKIMNNLSIASAWL
jgi:hypothetical protein